MTVVTTLPTFSGSLPVGLAPSTAVASRRPPTGRSGLNPDCEGDTLRHVGHPLRLLPVLLSQALHSKLRLAGSLVGLGALGGGLPDHRHLLHQRDVARRDDAAERVRALQQRPRALQVSTQRILDAWSTRGVRVEYPTNRGKARTQLNGSRYSAYPVSALRTQAVPHILQARGVSRGNGLLRCGSTLAVP